MQHIFNKQLGRRELIGRCLAYGALASLAPSISLLAASRKPMGRSAGGFSVAGLDRIDNTMRAMVERGETPGMVGLIYRRGVVDHVITAGWQNVESKSPMKRDTIFQIMSMTKPITATATLMLVDEGQISLYDPVEKFLPEFANQRVLRTPSSPLDDIVPAERRMRIVDLLTYRSGLVSTAMSPETTNPLTEAVGEIYSSHADDPDGWLKAIAELPLGFQPGTAWSYGTSSEVLAILISRVSEMSFAEFLQRRIYAPLGMKDTAHFMPPEKRSRLATVYQRDPETREAKVSARTNAFSDTPPAFPKGAGGLVSTVDDYLQFARMLLGKGEKDGVRILSHRAVSLMTSNYITVEQRAAIPPPVDVIFQSQGWGLGLSVVLDVPRQDENFAFSSLGSFGWPGAFGTWWQADPKEDMIQIYMHQFFTGAAWDLPRVLFQRLTYEAIDD